MIGKHLLISQNKDSSISESMNNLRHKKEKKAKQMYNHFLFFRISKKTITTKTR